LGTTNVPKIFDVEWHVLYYVVTYVVVELLTKISTKYVFILTEIILGCFFPNGAMSPNLVTLARGEVIHFNDLFYQSASVCYKRYESAECLAPILRRPGLPDFSWYKIPKRGKYTQ
jgi:hypothetical protein